MLALSAMPGKAAAQTVDGEVVRINAPESKMSLRHGPIPKLDMDSMTMVFRVQDPAMLTIVKVGDKVKFEADRRGRAAHDHKVTREMIGGRPAAACFRLPGGRPCHRIPDPVGAIAAPSQALPKWT